MRSTGDPLQDAAYLLLRHAQEEAWPHSAVEQRRILRKARRAVHPDLGGIRSEWDAVESAARTLGIEQHQRP